MLIFGIFITLLLLQFSCATTKKDQEYDDLSVLTDQAQAPSVASTGPLLLGDKHEAAGMACNDCHEEEPPGNDVPEAVCLTCHGDYNVIATSFIDPHNAHMTYSSCGDCHHAHQPSENQCLGCHSFSLQAP
jgi:hypothetical protein